MDALEIVVICEAVAAIVMVMVVIAVAAAIKARKKCSGRLYDPYGLYAPVTAAELAEADRAAAVNAEAARLQHGAQYAQSVQNRQTLSN